MRSETKRQAHEQSEASQSDISSDILWGCAAIAAEIGVDVQRANYLLSRHQIPGRKIGALWCSSRRQLRAALYSEAV
jgi:hypothetical protein